MWTPCIGRNLSFGRIAVQAGLVAPGRLDELLIEQDAMRKEGVRYKIGELCQLAGALSSAQVQKILLAQEFYRMRQDDELLAAVLERDGVLSEEVLRAALADQLATYRSESRVPESLGEMLVASGALDAGRLAAIRAADPDLRRAARRGQTEVLHVPERLPDPVMEPTGWLVAEGSGEVWPIRAKAILGRDPANEVAFDDARASRQHARIDWRPDQKRHVLVDLHSINGTWLNGTKLENKAFLAPGDRIKIGEVALVYDRRSPERKSAAAKPLEGRRAIPDERKRLTVHERLVFPKPPEEEIPVAEVVTPSPLPEVVPFAAAMEVDQVDAERDGKAELRALVDLRMTGTITPEEYQRRRVGLLSRL